MAEGSGAEILDVIGKRVGWLVALVGAIATVNTTITGCTQQTVARHETFARAVAAEEEYWRARTAEQLEIDRARVLKEEDAAHLGTRLGALCSLASRRPVPDFAEFGVAGWPWSRQRAKPRAAALHAGSMKDAFLARCTSDRSDIVRSATEDGPFAEQEDREQRQQLRASEKFEAITATDAAAVAAAPRAPASSGARVITAGSPKGYDVDIFFCLGGEFAAEDARRARAEDLAKALAATDTAKSEALAGSPLGRVRVRPLPLSRQGAGYPRLNQPDGLLVRYDADETVQGNALAKFLEEAGRVPFTASQGRSQTRWYLSAFVCAD